MKPTRRSIPQRVEAPSESVSAPFIMLPEEKPPALLPQTLEEYVQKLQKPDSVFNYETYLSDPLATVNRDRRHELQFGADEPRLTQPLKNLTHPTHLGRLRQLRDQGLMDDPSGNKVNPWYWPSPLVDAWTRELGDEAGLTQLGKFLDYTAATSPQTNVSGNVREGSVVYHADQQNIPFKSLDHADLTGAAHHNKKAMSLDVAEGRGIIGDGENTRNKVGSFALNLRGVGTAKPEYDFSGKSPRLLKTPVTMDSMMAEAMRYRDKEGNQKERFTNSAYDHAAGIIRNLGDEAGAAGADTQAAIWLPFQASKHGQLRQGTDYSGTFASALDDRIRRTAEIRQQDPRKVLEDLIHGRAPLLEANTPMPFVPMTEDEFKQ